MFCWNPQDFNFCINYSFTDGLHPSWPQSLCSVEFLLNGKLIEQLWKIESLFPPSFELGTFRVLGERDNHYTTETEDLIKFIIILLCKTYSTTLRKHPVTY